MEEGAEVGQPKWEAGLLGAPETPRVLHRAQLPYLPLDVAFLLQRCLYPHIAFSNPMDRYGFPAHDRICQMPLVPPPLAETRTPAAGEGGGPLPLLEWEATRGPPIKDDWELL